jgi:hypothetical protein
MSSQIREELRGRGNLYQGDTLLCDVMYEIHVFQKLIENNARQGTELKLKACYGDLYAPGYLRNLLGQEMTLHLEDGRSLECVGEDWKRGRLEITCTQPYT